MGIKVNKAEKDIEELQKLLKELSRKVNEKVGKEEFDSEISYLQKMIEKLQKQIDDTDEKLKYCLDSKEYNFFKELETKYPKMEKLINELLAHF